MSSPADASNCYGLSWIYDRYGNRTAQNATSGSCLQPQTPVNPNNRLQPPYQYDASGNMTADATHTYFYDAESRLIQVDGTLGNCSTATACYSYDARSARAEKITSAGKIDYIHDISGNVGVEWNTGINGSTGWGNGYIYLGGQLLAEYENGTTYFVHKDHLGDTRVMTGLPIVDVRFTNDSCTACSGSTAPGAGDRNLYVNSITVGSTTISPGDPSVSYNNPCNGDSGGVGTLLCNGDMIANNPAVASSQTITINAYGSFDLNVYPQMQLIVGGNVVGQWTVTGTAQNYTVTLPRNALIYDSMDYLPYGEQIEGGTGTTHKFTGKERDAESGLDDFDARYYSSNLGRFVSADWSATPAPVPYANFQNPQSLNLYAYVKNNPLNLTDPNGHCTVDGETHGSIWCGLHWAGLTSTAKEKADEKARYEKAEADWQAYRQSEVNAGRPDPKYIGGALMFAYGGAMGVATDLLAEPTPVSSASTTASAESEPSTGRTAPANLNEQLAMEQAKSNPSAGTHLESVKMTDPHWPADQGWQKMAQNINGVEVHYNLNTKTGATADWKFK